MPHFSRLLRKAYVAVAELTWGALLFITVLHVAASWIALWLSGERALESDIVGFLYYYVVTATTVGYGDLSPVTGSGRLIASFVVIPGAIAIFTATLGKLLTAVGSFWRRRMNGMGSFSDRDGHLIVLGWQDGATRALMLLLAAERQSGEPLPILVSRTLDTNPMPGEIDFVKSERLADPESLDRAGIIGARSVIVRGENDDETLAAALVAATINQTTHVVAHFEYARSADIVNRQNARVETVTSLSPELLVRAAHDPGSSQVARLLLSANTDDTAFSIKFPDDASSLRYGAVLTGLKRHHRSTLVGMARSGQAVDLNCDDDATVGPGDVLYYISDRRLDAARIGWADMGGAAA